MPEVVEIRVHGVGGTPPEALLGESLPVDLVRAAGDGKSAFFARLSNRRVEGYVWGPLTSSGLLQPLWIFLLPFTLLNVAGFTLPPKAQGQDKGKGEGILWTLARWLIFLAGLALTLDYVFGTSMVVVRQVFFQWRLAGLIKSREASIWLGAATMLLLGLVVFLLARSKQKDFEGKRYETGDPPEAGLLEKVRGSAEAEQGLAAEGFWNSSQASRRLLWLHAGVAFLGFALLLVTALNWGGIRWLGWTKYFRMLVFVNSGILAALLLVCFFLFGNPLKWFSAPRFRVLAPWSLTQASVGLATGFFGGAGLLLAKTLSFPDGKPIPNALELELTLAFGTAAFSAALVAIMVAAHLFGRATRETNNILSSGSPPANDEPIGSEPKGVPREKLPGVGRARALSEFGRNADLLITIPAVVFSLFAVPSVMRWLDFGQRLEVLPWVFLATSAITLAYFSARPVAFRKTPFSWAVVALPVVATLSTALFEFGRKRSLHIQLDQIAQLGGTMALFAVGAFLTFWVRGYFKPQQRRMVAILWDVLTFFPRRFHPLAVRPYAERAVPELIGRLLYQVDKEKRRVILSAHSQGSILGFAALSQLRRLDEAEQGDNLRLKEVAFVTYGCPLSQLHARVFPVYFSSESFGQLRDQLFSENVTEPSGEQLTAHPGSWRNFYRLTDYIGKQVYIGDDWEQLNQVIPDPAEQPMISTVPFDAIFEGTPDPFRAPWVTLSLHSHYNSDPTLKSWIRSLRETLQGPAG